MFMEAVLSFLTDLQQHNTRDWFLAHKTRFVEAQNRFNLFTGQLIMGLAELDDDIRGLQVSDCTYRIYRDVRFSADKSPYKTHMGAYVCPKGKKSGLSGYYFHLEPQGAGYLNGSLLACGLYAPEREVLQSIREEIVCNGDAFDTAVRQAEGFSWDDGKLKKLPKGFEGHEAQAEYLCQKMYSMSKPIPADLVHLEDLLEYALHEFNRMVPFNKLLNKAVEYAYEQKKEGVSPSW